MADVYSENVLFFDDPIPVLVVAADRLALAGLVALLEAEQGLQVIAAHDMTDEPDEPEIGPAQVAIIDLGWERADPQDERLEVWLDLGLPILVLLEAADRPAFATHSFAAGQLARHRDGAAIHVAAAALAAGLQVIDPELGPNPPKPVQIPERLTDRELDVLRLLAEGQSNRAIGQNLSISEHTVKFHVTSILSKLGAESRTEAAVRGVRAGLIVL